VTRVSLRRPHGEPALVPLERDKHGPKSAIVLVDEAGVTRAYVNRCMHIPVPLDAGGGDVLSACGRYLECRTHGARYRLSDGYCIEGPCEGDSLEPIAIDEEGEVVTLLV
jgi:nitrite reductase/ring-hydroxylating ferredoxin subunit